jgi:uncharacterized GH25 family protein
MKISLRAISLAAALAGTFGAAHAHNAWLLPSSTVLAKPDTVTFDAAVSNDLFVANHAALRLDNLQITAPDGTLVKPESETRMKHRSVFDLNAAQPGTYRISVINDGASASWKDKASGQTKRVRGTPETITKDIPADAQEVVVMQSSGRVETFVSVGKPTAPKPIGQGLELVATSGGLTDLAKGEKASFVFHVDGQPAANLDVTVTAGNTQYRDQLAEIKLKTDDKGAFTVTWPTAGMYWIDASTKDGKTTLPQAKERRLNYAATVEVMP